MKTGRAKSLAFGAVALAVVAAACGSSKTAATPTISGGHSQTVSIGVMEDVTGLGSSGNKTFVQGVKAGILMAKRAGYTISPTLVDTQTSPTAALSAATQLVSQDHVLAVLAGSSLTFAAAPYLTRQGIPVIGEASDGPEWTASKNMFSVTGFLDTTAVSTTLGAFAKLQGATNVGALGYGISPSSSDSAREAGLSAKAAGLKVGYVNANFDFGSTNVAPVALAMKSAGVDSVYSATDPNTSFALVAALRDLGDSPKVGFFPTGYGGDLLQAGPSARQNAQGLYFSVAFQPIEMQTVATKQFAKDLAAAGVKSEPTYAEYDGYVSVAALVAGLKSAGTDPTRASLLAGLAGVKGFNAAGLYGSHSFDFNDRTGTAIGVDGCSYFVRYSGSTFHLVSGAEPLCGTRLPGSAGS